MKSSLYLLITISLLALCAADTAGQQPSPEGSYLKSCGLIKAEGGKLTATCNPKGDAYTFLGGEQFKGPSTIESFFECYGDISNQNGNLACNRNPNASKLQMTRKSIDAAMMEVMGIPPNGDTERYHWIGRMFADGYQATFYKQGGFLAKNTTEFFRKHIAAPGSSIDRAGTIKQAFKDVYNLKPSPTDLLQWDQKVISMAPRFGYVDIVASEQLKMNGDKVIRRLMINNAYMTAFGRPASKGDFDYWLPRAEIFKEVLAAQRAWLYSPNGQKDLTDMITRSVENKNGKTNEGLLLQAAQKARAGKLIYSEM